MINKKEKTFRFELNGNFITALSQSVDTKQFTVGIDSLELLAKFIVKEKFKNKRMTTQDYIKELGSTLNEIREVVANEQARARRCN